MLLLRVFLHMFNCASLLIGLALKQENSFMIKLLLLLTCFYAGIISKSKQGQKIYSTYIKNEGRLSGTNQHKLNSKLVIRSQRIPV